MADPNASLYEALLQNFSSGEDLYRIPEEELHLRSVLDNIQRILSSRVGTLTHAPLYGLPDMSEILQGLPLSAHNLIERLRTTLLTYEPRLLDVQVELLPQSAPGQLEYSLDIELHTEQRVTLAATLSPQGKARVRRLILAKPMAPK